MNTTSQTIKVIAGLITAAVLVFIAIGLLSAPSVEEQTREHEKNQREAIQAR